MSEAVVNQIRQQLSQRGIYDRLLSTEEAAAATGLSQYELRIGAKDGRYPVIMCGRPGNKFRKMKWNLSALEAALQQQMIQSNGGEGEG